MSKGLQYVGSPWHSLKGVGGAGDWSTIDDSLLIHDKYSSTLLGDLSLRNRTLILQTIRNLQVIHIRECKYTEQFFSR